ncbi:MAG: hypothetical protein JSW02_03425 [candidate division WOR-3 bacterium]|nr:MAG: hypothetical protein JSW02_03425 [candidate division WOR-3 bacterium]
MKYWMMSIIVSLVFTGFGFAHPPTGVEMEFNYETKVLTVFVTHPVNKIDKHFVDKVVVELNDKEIVTQTFRKQKDGEAQEAMYIIVDAKVGDTIAVTGYCNVSGKKKVSLTVEEE